LRVDLADWGKRFEKDADKTRALVHKKMAHRRHHADLAGVRDDAALAKVPTAERDAWRKLWSDVDALLAKTQEMK
jgi:hypothetical protein